MGKNPSRRKSNVSDVGQHVPITTALDDKTQLKGSLKVDISVTSTPEVPLADAVTPVPPSATKIKHSSTSLWKFLLSELDIGDDKPTRAENSEKTGNGLETAELLNFVKLPVHLEKFMIFGLLYSAVIFLKCLVIIPLRFSLHLLRGKYNTVFKNDLITVSSILVTWILLKDLDTSRIYHNIRSGTAVKLYFMMQVLEIGDRLLSASGQDIFKLLMKISGKQKVHFVCFYIVSIIYLWFHSYVLVYQVMSMNVAINSYSNALLTLILSNQFSELKSAVFKKTEREGLFQVTCADLNERFLIFITLVIISARNVLQIIINTPTMNDFFNNFKPNSWSTQLTPWKSFDNWLGIIIGPSIYVIGSELLVDWIKHSYILRFNRIKPTIYDKYTTVLASDFIDGFKLNASGADTPSILSKRTGLPITTVMIVFCKLTFFPYIQYQYTLLQQYSRIKSFLIIFTTIFGVIGILVFIRLLLSLFLLRWSTKIIKESHQMRTTDYLPGDPNVTLCDVAEVREMLYDPNEKLPPSLGSRRLHKEKQLKQSNLNSVVRFEMADKRIW